MEDDASASLEQVANSVFVEVAPYLQYPDWVKATVLLHLKEVGHVEGLVKALEAEIAHQDDRLKQSDLRIYISHLLRMWNKKSAK